MAIRFDLDDQLSEPDGLNGFAEGFGRPGRHLPAYPGDLNELSAPGGILFFLRHFPRQVGKPSGKARGRRVDDEQ
jgi:hypothetical protein